MNTDLREIMAEYARLPFDLLPTRYMRTPPGDQVAYQTYLSAFIFPLRGETQFSIGENCYTLQPGKVLHGCPDRWLTAQNKKTVPFEFFLLYYQYEGAGANYMRCPYELAIGANPRIFAQLRQLAALWEKPNAQVSLQVKTLVYSVLAEMFASAGSMAKSGAPEVIEDARRFLERHYERPHTLRELGGRYDMRGKYFSDVFKKHVGISPIDYLISYRLEQAKKLLESTECGVKEIGESVGYKDAMYFSRQFRGRFGVSPSGYRERRQRGVG
jgi:AraC-like DNA-binding protein